MTIDEIKSQLGLVSLLMIRQFDEEGNKTEWVSHWDNDRRIRVSMHQSVMEAIKVDRSIDTLDINSAKVIAKKSGKEYTRYVVVIDKHLKVPGKKDGWREKYIGPDPDYNYSYDRYNGYDGYSDDDIDYGFEGDPSNTWGL